MKPIKWKTETRRLGDLIRWEPNPRQIKDKQAERLETSIREFGYSQLYEIEPDGTIIDGHQRDEIMLRMDEFGPDSLIEVRVASRTLTVEERKKYIALRHRGATGEWDNDQMLNLYADADELVDLGFDLSEVLAMGFQIENQELDYGALWAGMPEFENDDIKPMKSIKVHFNTQADIDEFAELVGQSVNEKTTFIWYPKQKSENLKQFQVVDDES